MSKAGVKFFNLTTMTSFFNGLSTVTGAMRADQTYNEYHKIMNGDVPIRSDYLDKINSLQYFGVSVDKNRLMMDYFLTGRRYGDAYELIDRAYHESGIGPL